MNVVNMGDVRKKENKKRKERNREVCVDVWVCVSGTKVSHPWFTKH